jgi:hypothetical protein
MTGGNVQSALRGHSKKDTTLLGVRDGICPDGGGCITVSSQRLVSLHKTGSRKEASGNGIDYFRLTDSDPENQVDDKDSDLKLFDYGVPAERLNHCTRDRYDFQLGGRN